MSYSFYQIINNADNHSYLGVTSYAPVNRIIDHMSKYYQTYDIDNLNKEISFNEYSHIKNTLYGEGPWVTGLNRMAAAIRLYGWESFSVRLIARGIFSKKEAYAIENQMIESNDNLYNVHLNSYVVDEKTANREKCWKRSCYVEFKNSKVDMFSLDNMSYREAEKKLSDTWWNYENSLHC